VRRLLILAEDRQLGPKTQGELKGIDENLKGGS